MSEIDNSAAVPTAECASPEVGPTLGERLRKARMACGMSIEDVVQALKFSARQIEAVEADHMEVLPGTVFQRGLVRSYARLLKLDPEPLLHLIEGRAPVQQPDIRPPENMGSAAPKGGIHQIPPLVALSVLLLIVAGAMIAWHFLGGGSMAKLRGAVDDARTAVQDVKPTDPVVQESQPLASPTVAPPQAEVLTAPTTVQVPVAVPAPVISTPAAPVPVPPTQVEPKTTSPVTVAPAAPFVPVSPAEGRRLTFQFQGESWIEVKDASGLVILTGIYHSGTQVVVGRPPFEVVIGSASAVTMKDDGRLIDLKPYTRAEVARVTLQ